MDALERKIIDEFYDLLCKVKKGYQPNYEFILEEISLAGLIKRNELDPDSTLKYLSYYLNNKWKTS